MKGFFSRLAARLKKKVGPAPLWVWVAIVLVIGIWYVRRQSAASATTAAATGTPADTGSTQATSPAFGDTSGGGGGGSPTPQSQPLSSGPVSWDPSQTPLDPGALPPADQSTPGVSTDFTPTPQTPTGAPTRTSRPSQPLLPAGAPGSVPEVTSAGITTVTPLQWGGQTFTTQSQFAAWAKSKGTNVAQELKNHPEAAKIYSQLGANPYVAATVPRPATAPSRAPTASAPRPKAAAAPSRTSAAPSTTTAPRQASAPTSTPAHITATPTKTVAAPAKPAPKPAPKPVKGGKI